MSSDDKLLSKYRDAVSETPEAGYILKTLDGSPVVLHVQLEDGKPPFIYGRAYLSEVLDQSLGWYARGEDDDKMVGWKCVLMTQARRAAVKRCGDQLAEGKINVKSLKVVRASSSGRSLLCEIHEFCDEEPTIQVDAYASTDGAVPGAEPSVPDTISAGNNGVDAGAGGEENGEE